MRLPTLTSVALLVTTVAASGNLHRIEDQKHRARDTIGEVNAVIDDRTVVHNNTEVVQDTAPRNDTERLYNGFRDLNVSWLDILLIPKDMEHPGGPKYLLAKCLDGLNPMGKVSDQQQPGDSELTVPPGTGRSDNDTITLEQTPLECQERVRTDLKIFTDVKKEDGRITITNRETAYLKPQDLNQAITISGFDEPRMEAFRAIAAGDLTYNEHLRLKIKQNKYGWAGPN
ncbi:hypothetical protein KJ359_000610 [Pestalotiopsis sp. 9143b]|nr:hypothetical protein KJ359_000610 [Pestalotiopsis sp. 9143b]